MAIFDGKFIRGVAGDVVFKQRGKKQLVQGKSKKSQIDMTQSTFDAAFIFGRASTLASYIRMAVDPIVRFCDPNMISRFTGECNTILQKACTNKDAVMDLSQDYFSHLNGFEFNNGSPLKKYFFTQPIVSITQQQVTIDLPEIQVPKDLKTVPDARFCVVAFSITLFDLDNDQYSKREIQSFEIELKELPLTVPAQQLKFEGAPGTLCIISMGLYYFERTFAGNAMINYKELSPAAILKAAFCPGETEIRKNWQSMSFNDKKKRRKLDQAKKKAEKLAQKNAAHEAGNDSSLPL